MNELNKNVKERMKITNQTSISPREKNRENRRLRNELKNERRYQESPMIIGLDEHHFRTQKFSGIEETGRILRLPHRNKMNGDVNENI